MAPLISVVRKTVRLTTTRHLKPILDERRMKMAELGDSWEDQPVSNWVQIIAIRRL